MGDRSDSAADAAIRADDRLMRAVAAGDDEAFGRVITAESPRLTRFVAAVLCDLGEAEEVVQEALVRLWRNADAWEPRARIGTWLHQVAYRLSIDRLRRRRPHVDIDDLDDVLEDDAPSPERQLSRIEDVRLVHEALDRMPDRQRAVIVLAHFQELGQAEASAVMGMSEHAYESLLARARRRLRGLLAGQRDEDGEDWT
ncbi:sigma-70 family RNA polymerase sigma factor [Kaistia geumhonensis]|uniref:RNA polymerase sigma-70 factor (ECF subfamily) n=1 Tax=Kaistia geumhonensis TaxID=410839 RepID=A0ABU0M3Y2_9HYPH|nr:sigma-70 family RNA polymerase sigma factor [Kaistia geumhonensis]MCX5479138.1 sigma-70 family RNA polymerase sigma factor [Kaistia geumhonensis]MDQ0515642.1 RNA polymerase sigma-70 factor (ECF subfamily) [Kaistia geumhonensis]